MRNVRRLSIRKRLERLEAARQHQAGTAAREAIVEIFVGDCVERHLETGSLPDAGLWIFQERPGPGPQLADFGEFASVLYLTPAEMEA